LTFEVLCARLQDKIHDLQKHGDPLLTLYDADGHELAANDDFYFADSLLTFKVAKTGDYFVQIRDSKYDGDNRWVYAIQVTDRPYVTHVFRMGGNAGQTVQVQPVGAGWTSQARLTMQAPMQPGVQEVQLQAGGALTNPVAVIVSPLSQVFEQEPNDTPEQA